MQPRSDTNYHSSYELVHRKMEVDPLPTLHKEYIILNTRPILQLQLISFHRWPFQCPRVHLRRSMFPYTVYIIKLQKKRKRGLLYSVAIKCLISLLFQFIFLVSNGIMESIAIFLLRSFLCWNLYIDWNTNFFTRLQVDNFPEKYQTTLFGAA